MRLALAILVLAGIASPWADAVAAKPGGTGPVEGPLHASYDVAVWDEAAGRWRGPTPDDGVPEHWEWWTTAGSAIDAGGRPVATTAFHQATWLPDTDWTGVATTHVDAGSAIVREDSRRVGLPPFHSDVGFSFGANGFQLIAAGPTEGSQTVQEARFGEGALPCGHGAVATAAGLAMGGSCGDAWPSGEAASHRLRFAAQAELKGDPAAVYESAGMRVWMADGIAVPARIEAGGLLIDLVGFRGDGPASGMQEPSVGRQPPAAMPWASSPVQPWGLDEAGAGHGNPFPASEAYRAALQGTLDTPLALFLLQHPDARPYAVQSASWKAGERVAHRWDFLIADHEAVWNGSVVHEVEGPLEITTAYGSSQPTGEFHTRLPPLAQVPDALPTLGSLLARWSGWTGEPPEAANRWGYAVSCADPGCSSAQTAFVVGRALWEFPTQRPEASLTAPSRLQGTTNVAAFGLDGAPLSLAESDWRVARVDNVGFSSPDGAAAAAPRAAPRLWGIEEGQAKAIAGLALAGALAALAYRALPLAVGLYARIRTDTLPEHPTRAAILDLVSASPGLRYSDLLRILGGGKGALEYHLRLLENGGHLVLIKRNGLATYFRTRQAGEGHAMAWLRSTTARRILGLLAEQPRPTAALHALAGCSRSTAHGHLVRIEAAGLVRREGRDAVITEAGRKAWDAVQASQPPG